MRFKEHYKNEYISSAYLDEGIADWIFTYQMLKRLALPFTKWPAYEHGLIDDSLNRINKPKETI